MRHITQPTVSVILGRLALLLFAAAVAGSLAAHPGKEKYAGGVSFHTEGGPPEGPCLSITGRLIASEFFANLEKRKVRTGVEFWRDTEVVTHFPAELSVRLRIQELPCHAGLLEESPLKLTPKDMNSLRFVAHWKREMRLRPGENPKLRRVHQERAEIPLTLSDLTKKTTRQVIEREIWVYDLAVASADVPLTDHLILVILTKDGRRLARVSARL